jgi:hypothetical protein
MHKEGEQNAIYKGRRLKVDISRKDIKIEAFFNY